MMKKLGLPGLLVMVLLLSACTSQTSTAAPAGTNPQVPTRAGQAVSKKSDCTISKAGYPTAGATESSLFLPITASDWTLGSASASVTIIEYSDFQ